MSYGQIDFPIPIPLSLQGGNPLRQQGVGKRARMRRASSGFLPRVRSAFGPQEDCGAVMDGVKQAA